MFDRVQHVEQPPDLFALVEGSAARHPVRDLTAGERFFVEPHVAHPAEEQRHVAEPGRPPVRSDLPGPAIDVVAEERGEHLRLAPAAGGDVRLRGVLPSRVEQHQGRGIVRCLGPGRGVQRHVVGLVPAVGRPPHPALEDLVDGGEDRRGRAEVGRDVLHGSRAQQHLLGLFVGLDVRPPEGVDRLLGIAHDEQLPGPEAHLVPRPGAGAVFGQEKDDLGLERVRILELVHQDRIEAALEVGADLAVVAEEVARLEQEVVEIEHPLPRLQGLVDDGVAAQPVHRARGQPVGVRGSERFELVAEGAEAIPDPGEHAGGPVVLPPHHLELQPAEDPAAHLGFAQPGEEIELPFQRTQADRGGVGGLEAAGSGPGDAGAHLGLGGREPGEGVPRGRPAIPGLDHDVPVPQQRVAYAAQLPQRHPALDQFPERSPSGVFLPFQPAVPRLRAKQRRAQLVGDRERGIHPRLHRPLPQEIGRKRVDRRDGGDLEILERRPEPLARGADVLEARLDPLPDLHAQFGGGFLGERDRDDGGEPRPAGGHQGFDPVHEQPRLPGSCAGFDDEIAVEVGADARAGGFVAQRRRRHSISHIAARAAMAGSPCFRSTSRTRPWPHTGWKEQ